MKLRLFCFPYAGGGPWIYQMWPDLLPDTVEVCPVQLPGRGGRLKEKACTRLSVLVEMIIQGLRTYLDTPYAFFGHSLGALISFELARRLRRENVLQPEHLFVSGRAAPHLPLTTQRTYDLPDPKFLESLRQMNGTPEEVMAHDELMQLLLPVLKADFEICQTYAYADGPPLACPISAFGGTQDGEVARDQVEAWRIQTKSRFSLHMLAGDHFFLHSAKSTLLRVLSQELRGMDNGVN